MARWKNTTPAPTAGDLKDKVELKWTIGFLTPMFGGGVTTDQKYRHRKRPDPITPIRVSSIKGQLRFWWRAAIGSKLSSIKEMRERETALFGNAGNRAKVEISIRDNQPVIEPIDAPAALDYGIFPLRPDQGVHDANGRLTKVKGTFQLWVTVTSDTEEEIKRTVETWLAFGGLGGRTRRGFGALSGGEWDIERILKVGDGPTLPGVPSLTGALFKKVSFESSDDAHKYLLGKLKSFRQGVGIGRNQGKQNRPGRSRWPEPDMIRRIMQHHATNHSPSHIVQAFPRGQFGMPIIFHFQPNQGDPADTTLIPEGFERMASPLILRPWKHPTTKEVFAFAFVLSDPGRKQQVGTLTEKNNKEKHRVRLFLEKSEADWQGSPLSGEQDPLKAFLEFLKKEGNQ